MQCSGHEQLISRRRRSSDDCLPIFMGAHTPDLANFLNYSTPESIFGCKLRLNNTGHNHRYVTNGLIALTSPSIFSRQLSRWGVICSQVVFGLNTSTRFCKDCTSSNFFMTSHNALSILIHGCGSPNGPIYLLCGTLASFSNSGSKWKDRAWRRTLSQVPRYKA